MDSPCLAEVRDARDHTVALLNAAADGEFLTIQFYIKDDVWREFLNRYVDVACVDIGLDGNVYWIPPSLDQHEVLLSNDIHCRSKGKLRLVCDRQALRTWGRRDMNFWHRG